MSLLDAQVRTITVGSHAAIALRRPIGPWRVIASFPRAVYIGAENEVIVFTSWDVPPGPIHATTSAIRVETEPGSPVEVAHGLIEMHGLRVELADAEPWVGRLPQPAQLRDAGPTLIVALEPHVRASALTSPPFANRLSRLAEAAEQLDLDAVAGALLGLGPGLTPAGDDALAGFLVTSVAMGRLPASSWQVRRDDRHLTNPISLAYIHRAAEGQAIAPVHDVLTAATTGDARICEAACRELTRVGGTSGADIALGLLLALRGGRGKTADPSLRTPAALT